MSICLLSARVLAGPPQPDLAVGILSRHAPRQLWVEADEGRAMLSVEVEAVDGQLTTRGAKRVALRCDGPGGVRGLGLEGRRFFLQAEGSQSLILELPGKLKRRYKGRLEISEKEGVCRAIIHSPFEAYVEGVSCAELGRAAPVEALRAQAVVVRGFAAANRGRHAAEAFDFCDLTHCQVFTGQEACSSVQRRALSEVRGKVLLHEGALAQVAFFSTCAGHTAAARDVWGPAAARPYLEGVEDGQPQVHCAASDHWRWRFETGTEDLCRRLGQEFSVLGPGPCSIRVRERGRGGWVREVEIEAGGRLRLSGARFHMLLGRWYGWARFKSGRFRVETRGERLVFLGRGMGHGVGMCQHGAMGMARRGASAAEILQHYFPGTSLGMIP